MTDKVMNVLTNEDLWDGAKPACGKCFPTDWKSIIPCLPQCLFTSKGFGAPDVVADTFKDKTPVPRGVQPLFIVAYGPPGSGKNSMVDVLNKLMPETESTLHPENVISVNVDALFQDGPLRAVYSTAMDAVRTHFKRDKTKYSQRLYNYFRWVADQISDIVLNTAIASKFHVLWETTGETTEWTKREIKRIRDAGYATWLVMPLVNMEELQKRLVIREKKSGQEPTPPEEMSHKVVAALTNLLDLLTNTQCPDWVATDLKYAAGSCSPDRVILYDNAGSRESRALLFDSHHPTQHCKALQKALPSFKATDKAFYNYFKAQCSNQPP